MGHRACFQATGGENMTHFVWIIQRKMWIEGKGNDKNFEVKYDQIGLIKC